MNDQPSRLLASQRRDRILAEVNANGTVSSRKLIDVLHASVSTVRRDLDDLEREGMVVRTRGGVTAARLVPSTARPALDIPGGVTSSDGERPASSETTSGIAEADAIVNAAFARIKASDSLLLDAGDIPLALAARIALSAMAVTVITNDLRIALSLAEADHVTLMTLGGTRRPKTAACFGEPGLSFLRRMTADHLFMEGHAVQDGIVWVSDGSVADWKRSLMGSARQRTLLCHSAHFKSAGLFRVADLGEFNEVICGAGIPDDTRRMLTRSGVRLRTVSA